MDCHSKLVLHNVLHQVGIMVRNTVSWIFFVVFVARETSTRWHVQKGNVPHSYTDCNLQDFSCTTVRETTNAQQLSTVCVYVQLPFDVVRGLGDEKSLRVTVELQFWSRVDRDVTFCAVFVACFDGYQQ